MTSTQTMEPSRRAYAAAGKLGRKAARNDTWLEVVLDDLDLAATGGDAATAHRESWQQTDHWRELYGRPLSDLADQQARRLGVTDCEPRFFHLYEPLVDAFWDAWEEAVRFWDLAESAGLT